jgi:hypothetical protein
MMKNSRPSADHLTEYYMLMSIGGALGGIFNAIVAPMIFSAVFEYPIVLIIACALVIPWPRRKDAPGRVSEVSYQDLGWGLIPGVLAAGLIYEASTRNLPIVAEHGMIFYALIAILCLALLRQPLRFTLGLAGVLIAFIANPGTSWQTLHKERSFFGVLRVSSVPSSQMYSLAHGTTLHGMQVRIPARRRDPLTYYYRTGPIGDVFRALYGPGVKTRAAMIGLGAGTLAAYAEPGQEFTFYEIDPAVERIARNPEYFTYLSDAEARGAKVNVVIGDARLTIRHAPSKRYDLIVLDAFSSDSIPTHLLTREALAIYKSKLSDHGTIAVHISNRFLNLEPVVANLAADAHLACISRNDSPISQQEIDMGKAVSHWLLLARRTEDFGVLQADARWKPIHPLPGLRVWTDGFSNILSVIKWHGDDNGR